jgi:hypothetical protein
VSRRYAILARTPRAAVQAAITVHAVATPHLAVERHVACLHEPVGGKELADVVDEAVRAELEAGAAEQGERETSGPGGRPDRVGGR